MFHFSVELAKWPEKTVRNYIFQFGDHHKEFHWYRQSSS